ncbi:Uu.00g119240.m01.CDS01 [Anthostomella pinea]|uniref:Uu.00g119240.m01.CDS01 n=1 Tax=Anthostomella pinea TaxID=933095 RepID=A0AAI8YH06_9PEZI|nr:Uu.00g119240.m01.CDS01 [Anthostomella pinea]
MSPTEPMDTGISTVHAAVVETLTRAAAMIANVRVFGGRRTPINSTTVAYASSGKRTMQRNITIRQNVVAGASSINQTSDLGTGPPLE